MKTISDIANEIFENEFGSDPSIVPLQSITSWLESNIGKLNVLLYECFESPDPDLNDEAADIYKCMYMLQFYQKKSANALRGILDGTESSVIRIQEGDTTIVKSNKNEVAKALRSISKDYKESLDVMTGRYHLLKSSPKNVSLGSADDNPCGC